MLILSKQLKKRLLPIFLVELIILIAILLLDYFNIISVKEILNSDIGLNLILICGILLFVIPLIIVIIIFVKIDNKIRTDYISSLSSISSNIDQVYDFGQVGLIIYDNDGYVTWITPSLIEKGIDFLGKKVEKISPEIGNAIKGTDDFELASIAIGTKNASFSVKVIPVMKIMVLKDVTTFIKLQQINSEQATVMIRFVIDNYQELFLTNSEEAYNEKINIIKDKIYAYCKKFHVYLRSLRIDTFLGVMTEDDYNQMSNDKFSIVDSIKQGQEEDKLLTISIGIARGTSDMLILGEQASNAINIALSRGGDQIVVNNYGSNMLYFGGKTESKTNKNPVRAKVYSRSLAKYVQDASNIIIMGHTNADFDAIAASIGMRIFCKAVSPTKKAYVVYDEDKKNEKKVENKVRQAVKQEYLNDKSNDYFVTTSKALSLIDQNTLFVFVDFHNSKLPMSREIFEKASKIIILDHHRRGEEISDHIVFSLIDPSYSSTSEIIVDLIKNSNTKIPVRPILATFLLAGILLDTDFFKRSVNQNTLDAVMFLKSNGGDIGIATNFLKDEFEEVIAINGILANSTMPVPGIMVAVSSSKDILERTIFAKVAVSAASIKGVQAAFVMGYIGEKTVAISARSEGEYNVQIVLEAMGGGGHFNSAATQIANTTIEETKAKLLDEILKYEKEKGGK